MLTNATKTQIAYTMLAHYIRCANKPVSPTFSEYNKAECLLFWGKAIEEAMAGA